MVSLIILQNFFTRWNFQSCISSLWQKICRVWQVEVGIEWNVIVMSLSNYIFTCFNTVYEQIEYLYTVLCEYLVKTWISKESAVSFLVPIQETFEYLLSFDEYQLTLLKVLIALISLNIVFICIAWNYYKDVIWECSIRPSKKPLKLSHIHSFCLFHNFFSQLP